MECWEPFEGAGEISLVDSGGEALVMSKEDEVGMDGANRSEEIPVASQERACAGESPPNVFEAHTFRFLWHYPFYVQDGSVASHKDEEFAPLRCFT